MARERRVGWRDVADLIPATLHLLRARRRMRRAPVGDLLAIDAARESLPLPVLTPELRAEAERIGRAVSRAARYGPVRERCLASSLAIRAWLDARGIRGAVIRLGVRRVGGAVQAHAWVTLGDAVLGDSPSHVQSFSPIAVSAAAGLRW